MGKLVRGITKNARLICVDSKEVIQKAQEIHNCSPTAIAGFGRLLSIGLMMGVDLKNDDDNISLKITSEGPVKQMLVTANKKGEVKGYMQNPYADKELREDGKLDVGGIIGKGNLQVIKDMGIGKPYVGVSNLVSGEIAEDFADYFARSEQIPSVVGAGVLLGKGLEIKQAGGFIIQLMPNATEEFIQKMENKVKEIKSVTELLAEGKTPQEILEYLMDGVEEVEILQETEVAYSCDCNKDKFYRGLISLGKKEVKSIFTQQEQIETACHFCHKKYKFKKEEFKEFLK